MGTAKKSSTLASLIGAPTVNRRTFLAGGVVTGMAAILDKHFGFASPCTFTDGNGLPVYWNGWNVVTNDPTNLGASTFSPSTPPAVVARDANHIDAFVIGNDNKVWTDSWAKGTQNSAWAGWNQIAGGPFSNLTPPVAVARDASHLDVFVIGTDSYIWTNSWAGTSWGGWNQIPGGPFSKATPIAAVAPSSGHLNIFAMGNDNRIWTNSWAGSWAGWSVLSSNPSNLSVDNFSQLTPPVAISRDSAHLDIFAVGTDSYIWTNTWAGTYWTGWSQIYGGPFSNATPIAVVAPDATHLNIFAVGNDSRIWTNSWDGAWYGWSVLSSNPADVYIDTFSKLTAPAAVARNASELNVFVLGNDKRVWTNSWDATDWCGWHVVSDNAAIPAVDSFSSSTPPAVVCRDANHIDVLVLGGDTRLYRNTWGQAIAVYIPQSTTRVSQLTSNYDPTGLPHINNTTAWGIPGTDMGIPVEFNGSLYILYGDVASFPGSTNPNNADPICYTNDSTVGPNGISLSCVLKSSGGFRPFTISGYGIMGGDETPTGAFSYNGILYSFVVRGDGNPYSSLTGTTDPSTDFTAYYDVSDITGKFWQIAPWVVQNANYPGLPSNTGDGLLLWGQSYNSIYLAWMPLTPGVNPPPQSGLRYYAGAGVWSTSEAAAIPVTSTIGITAISVTWLAGPQQWMLMYTRASLGLPHESIVCRVAFNPWDWSDEITLFNPDREGAWGQYMHMPGADTLNSYPINWPDNVSGWAYAPFLLNRFTSWNPTSKVATIFYSMATFDPYQVMLMKSEVQFG